MLSWIIHGQKIWSIQWSFVIDCFGLSSSCFVMGRASNLIDVTIPATKQHAGRLLLHSSWHVAIFFLSSCAGQLMQCWLKSCQTKCGELLWRSCDMWFMLSSLCHSLRCWVVMLKKPKCKIKERQQTAISQWNVLCHVKLILSTLLHH